MNIKLYRNSSDPRKVDKSISELASFENVTFKDGQNIMNPSIKLTLADDSLISNANYVYIEDLQIYYFITEVTTNARGVYDIQLHEDVLSTYKVGVRNLTAVIRRQENVFNQYLDDEKYKTYNYKRVQTFKFPVSLSNKGDSSYILAVAGGVSNG